MRPKCDLDLEDSNPVSLHDTPAYDNVSLYHVWLPKIQHFRRYHPNEHELKFLMFAVTLISNPIFSLNILVYDQLPSSYA